MNLHENWNRYYDPVVGQYTSVDPISRATLATLLDANIGRSSAAYTYAANNPIKNSDSTGLMAWIDECEGGGINVFAAYFQGGGAGGAGTFTGLQFERTDSTVQFWTGNDDACDDLRRALEVQKSLDKGGYGDLKGCWRKLVKQMFKKCDGYSRLPGHCSRRPGTARTGDECAPRP